MANLRGRGPLGGNQGGAHPDPRLRAAAQGNMQGLYLEPPLVWRGGKIALDVKGALGVGSDGFLELALTAPLGQGSPAFLETEWPLMRTRTGKLGIDPRALEPRVVVQAGEGLTVEETTLSEDTVTGRELARGREIPVTRRIDRTRVTIAAVPPEEPEPDAPGPNIPALVPGVSTLAETQITINLLIALHVALGHIEAEV